MSRVPGTVSGASKVDPAFPLGASLSFTDSATGVPVLFARFAGTMETSDSRGTYMSGFGISLPRPSPVAIRRGQSVHPRVCGEHLTTALETEPDFGSSPRVRGTPPSLGSPPPGARFIPACAGNTLRMCVLTRASAVHPRVCGEHA